MLRHFLDEDAFGDGFHFVLEAKTVKEMIEFVLIFRRQDGEGASKTVAEIVEAGRGSPGFTGACRVLRVGAVGADLSFS